MEIKAMLDVLDLAEQLKIHTRHSWTSSGRRESVAEHCWRAALMAYFLKDEFPEADMDRVIKMCLFHDMGEAFTGDIPCFEKTSRDEIKERDCVQAWLESLPLPYREELMALFLEMEAQETPEAKLYKAIDKLEVVVQHNEAKLSTWEPLEYELNLHYGMEQCAFSPYLQALRAQISEDTREKIGASETSCALE